MINLLLVEDNERLRPALAAGLAATGALHIAGDCGSGGSAVQRLVVVSSTAEKSLARVCSSRPPKT